MKNDKRKTDLENKNISGYKEIKLSELLNKSDIKIVRDFINKNEWDKLKDFLNSRNSELMTKGVIADYLYYCLEYGFKIR